MYHSPVPVEAEEAIESPAGGESLGVDTASEKLRDAHLRNGQVEARALFAPFLAITSA